MFKQLSVLLGAGLVTASSAITVSTMTTPEALVNSLLGEGVTLIDGSINYKGSAISAGTYSGATVESQGNGWLTEGIVLSTGNTSFLNNNENTSDAIGQNLQLSGDADLGGLIPGYATYDATVLEFDFTVSGAGDVTSSFWYVFGSEEYTEYVGSSFNDVFGFFLDDQNIALIPGTTTPVSINNVNSSSYSSYFNNNDLNQSGTEPFATEMDGFTKPLSTQFTLAAGTQHHMKMAIADAGDHILDSWVLLGGNSFINQAPTTNPLPTSVPEPYSLSLFALSFLGLVGSRILRKRS